MSDAKETMIMKKTGIGTLAGLGIAVVLASLPGALDAQAGATRIGWQPYLGCWQPQGAAAEEGVLSQGVLCFVPAGSEVEMLTIAEGVIAYREPFPADGRTRAVDQEGCQGTESARFSDDQQRIYTTSNVTCENESPRRSSGIIYMPGADEWLDVRAMEMNGETKAWSQWYQRTGDEALEAAGISSPRSVRPFAARGAAAYASAQITIDDVIDATRNVDPKAVEGWIAAVRQGFSNLDAEDLVRLDDAGVPAVVIDVVVAVSFPRHFAFNGEQAFAEEGPGSYRVARTIRLDPFGYYSPYGNGYYSPYGYGGYNYGYGAYGYGYGGYGYGGRWGRGYAPVVVHVDRADNGGRVVAGKGYRRGPRTMVQPPSSMRGGSSWDRGSSRSGGASSSGSSGGSRKAKPRGGKSSQVTPMPSRGSSSGRKAKPRGGR